MSTENTISKITHTINSTVLQLFNPKINKPKIKYEHDPTFSIDVCTIDEHGLHNVACYDFENETWLFHTDTQVDYDEPGSETKWLWYYPVVNASDVF